MPSRETTTVEIRVATWTALNRRKQPGDSFDDVIRRALDLDVDAAADTTEPPTAPPIEIPADVPSNKDREEVRALVADAIAALEADPDGLSAREFVAELIEAHPLGYDDEAALEKVESGDRIRGAWWRRVLKPCLEAHPDVQKPKPGGSKWTWVGAE